MVTAWVEIRRSSGRSPPRRWLRGLASVLPAPRDRGCKESEAFELCPVPFGMSTRRFGMGLYLPVSRSSRTAARKPASPDGFDVLKSLAIDASGTTVPLGYTVGLFEGLLPCHMHEDAPEAMCLFRLRLPIYPSSQLLQTRWVPLSSHPCLTLTNGILTGPGPSLRARFAARPSTVLRPDPSP